MSEDEVTDAIADAAESALSEALESGQSEGMADMNVTRVPARDAFDILRKQREDAARNAGRRPLFRGINLGGMS